MVGGRTNRDFALKSQEHQAVKRCGAAGSHVLEKTGECHLWKTRILGFDFSDSRMSENGSTFGAVFDGSEIDAQTLELCSAHGNGFCA